MADLYVADLSALPDPKDAGWLIHRLCAERQKRIFQFARADDRKRCMGAGLLLAKILPLYGASPEEVRTGANGKPTVPGIGFNLSHAGNLAVCAVGNGAVGCDVEQVAEIPEGIAEHFFHPNEKAYLESHGGEMLNENFFRIWTMKESYLKMTGEGLSLPLNKFEVIPGDGVSHVVRENRFLACRITEYSIMEYKAAVCAQEPCSLAPRLVEIVDFFN